MGGTVVKPRSIPWLALGWLAAIILAGLAAPILAPSGPYAIVGRALSPASSQILLGTDSLGRDMWARILFGARLSLGMSLGATILTALPGGALGLVAASLGGWVERGILWLANTLLSIPGLILALLLVAILGPGLGTLTLAVGLGGVPGFVRVSRTAFRAPKSREFVAASRALGAEASWIAVRHLLPNARLPLTALITTYFAWAFAAATSLTFLGFGGDPALPEWGAMLQSGRAHLFVAPGLALYPGCAIAATVWAVHALGSWMAGFRNGLSTRV